MHEIYHIVNMLDPISLGEMDSVQLMNRVDSKYVMPIWKVPELIKRLNGDYRALEICGLRNLPYTTTYVDSPDHLFFNQHVTGKLERNKVRFRRYETTGTSFLEVKKTTNKKRTIKWRVESDFPENSACDSANYDFIKEYIQHMPHTLQPSLTNRFHRITLVCSEFQERITIDYNISFAKPNGLHINIPSMAILEAKREGWSTNSGVANILKDLSIHPTGFSKYCVGSAILYDLPRKNILKQKLLLINKITNEFNNHNHAQ